MERRVERAVVRAFAAGAELDLRRAGAPGAVDAGLLVRLLAGVDAPEPTGVPALRLAGALVRGPLALAGATVTALVELTGCAFDTEPDLRAATVAGLALRGCALPGLRAANLRVASDLDLSTCTVDGPLRLTDATVDGSLRLDGAVLDGGPGGPALLAERIAVSGALHARGVDATGELRLPGARVTGDVDLDGAELAATAADALDATGLRAGGSLRLAGAGVDGRLVLAGADVGGDAVFSRARLHAPDDTDGTVLVLPRGRPATATALAADRLTVAGNLLLDAGLGVRGTVVLAHARVGGYLRLTGAALHAELPPGAPPAAVPVALLADGAQVGGDLEARGEARDGVSRDASDDPGEDVDGHAALRATGQVRLVDARVLGSASLSGVRLDGPGLDVLFADRLHVGGALFLRRLRATGSVRLQNAAIGSTLDCTGARLTDPRRRPDGSVKPSLDVRAAEIGKDLFCSHGFVATGGARLRRAEVGKAVSLDGAVLGGAGGVALNAYGLVCQELGLRLGAPPRGDVRLTLAVATTVSDSAELWAGDGRVDLEDFRYEALESDPPVPVAERLRRLRRALPHYDPDPYDQLAASYRDAGHDERADAVLLAKQRHRHRDMTVLGRAWGWLQEVTVGYGYRPWLAVVWLAVFWAAGAAWFLAHRLPKLDSDQDPAWNPVLYAADLLVPVVNLGQDGLWRTAGASAWVAGALTVVGWTLASTAAAGATRILTRS